jgi:hypothetical protein
MKARRMKQKSRVCAGEREGLNVWVQNVRDLMAESGAVLGGRPRLLTISSRLRFSFITPIHNLLLLNLIPGTVPNSLKCELRFTCDIKWDSVTRLRKNRTVHH